MQLLTFSLTELYPEGECIPADELMIKDGYPSLFKLGIPTNLWFPNYLGTYIEQDVKQVKNITDLIVFERFIRLLAGRVGQELNMTAHSIEVGVDNKTIPSWRESWKAVF